MSQKDEKSEETFKLSRFLMSKQRTMNTQRDLTPSTKRFTPNVNVERRKTLDSLPKPEGETANKDGSETNLLKMIGKRGPATRLDHATLQRMPKISQDRRNTPASRVMFGGVATAYSYSSDKKGVLDLVNKIEKPEEMEEETNPNTLKPVKLPFVSQSQTVKKITADGEPNTEIAKDTFFLVQLPRSLPLQGLHGTFANFSTEDPPLEDKIKDTENKLEILDYLVSSKIDGAGFPVEKEYNSVVHDRTAFLKEKADGIHLGKLVLYKSGKLKMRIGEVLYDLNEAARDGFYQELASLDKNNNEISFMTPLTRKFIMQPDVEEMLKLQLRVFC